MNLLRRFLDRRRHPEAKEGDQRKPTLKEANERVQAAIEDLDRTVSMKRHSANDVQRHVKFDTFAIICEFRYQNGHAHSICKHKDHEAAGTGVATCAESVCPFCRHRK